MTQDFRRRPPVSTYRLQFNGAFRFADARDLVPYLEHLGITACYSSPHLKANPGSTHGYDICDHRQLNPELGNETDYHAFTDALAGRGLGHIIDIVPNHMAADPVTNRWWRDVIENGPSSPFGAYFDVDWEPIKPELKGRVLLPILGDQYGVVLENGELQVRFQDGTLVLGYGGLNLPLNPRQLPRVLGIDPDIARAEPEDGDQEVREYLSIMTALANLPPYTERDPARISERHREKEVARQRLARLVQASPRVGAHVDACVTRLNGVVGDRDSFNALHDLLERQAYRLAYWRTAFDEINYRRFFDVNSLVALRMERREVFEATHALLAELVAEGRVTGFRVDHPDGLFDPLAYLERLQSLARTARPTSAPDAEDGEAFYVVVEKILSAGESLRQEWPVAGTTGYDFLNSVAGLFVDTRQLNRLRRIYARFTGAQSTFEDVAFQCKRVITLSSMASELSVLSHGLNRLSEADRRCRDFTLDSCRKVLREVLAGLPVYRTYLNGRGVSAFDRAAIETAIDEAMRRNPVMEESIFAFVRGVLLPTEPAAPEDHSVEAARLRFAMALQQFSGPVQAKGVEDTAFYRYHVLSAANDVGGHPGRPSTSPAEFHAANERRLADFPAAMIATATHDTKRGEDARVRLAVLSEIPDDWRRAVSDWMRTNARHRTRIGTMWAPDRNDEYLFYQALLGAWPAETADAAIPTRALGSLVARIDAYMQKAVREAKVHTSWVDQDQSYGHAVSVFVKKTLAGKGSARFLGSFVPLARRIARVGAVNALAQLVLKLASPGVADFYQGTELWDLSLVDPDNRRSVDFALRRALLDELEPLLMKIGRGDDVSVDLEPVLEAWPDGRIKLFVTTAGLRFRRDHPDVLREAPYRPLDVEGPLADHVVAFARPHASGTLVAIAPRLAAGLMTTPRLRLDDAVWEGTSITLPQDIRVPHFRNLLTGEIARRASAGDADRIEVGRVLRSSPVALLWSGA